MPRWPCTSAEGLLALFGCNGALLGVSKYVPLNHGAAGKGEVLNVKKTESSIGFFQVNTKAESKTG